MLALAGVVQTWQTNLEIQREVERCQEVHETYEKAIQSLAEAAWTRASTE